MKIKADIFIMKSIQYFELQDDIHGRKKIY